MARRGTAHERREKGATSPSASAIRTTYDALRVSARRDRQTGRTYIELFPPPGVLPPVPRVYGIRCNRCRRWTCSGTLGGRVLGLESSYCASCIDELVVECRAANDGQLPKPGTEFFCSHCEAILPSELLTPPDKGGRRRWYCRTCRAKQIAKANDRRARRRAAANAKASR